MTQDEGKEAFVAAFDAIVSKCALFAINEDDRIEHPENLLISFYDVCAVCNFCGHCLSANIHDRLGMVYIETKLGVNTLIPVVNRELLLAMILNIRTEKTVELQGYWVIGAGLNTPKEIAAPPFADADEEFLKNLWKE